MQDFPISKCSLRERIDKMTQVLDFNLCKTNSPTAEMKMTPNLPGGVYCCTVTSVEREGFYTCAVKQFLTNLSA